MITPDSVETGVTLLTAAARHEELRLRDALSSPDGPPLPVEETLELLALGEVIARKARYGRQLAVRSARAAGASWSQIGGALGTSKQSAWELHGRWIDGQAELHRQSGYEGLDETDAAAARALAGTPDPFDGPGDRAGNPA
jgi:hypothetical protein